MADKSIIALGEKLHRLMESDDFSVVLEHLAERNADLRGQLEAVSSVLDCAPHIASHAAQRLDELSALSGWIEDAIERGGQELIKQKVQEAKDIEKAEKAIVEDAA